jgi:hypothetical protein
MYSCACLNIPHCTLQCVPKNTTWQWNKWLTPFRSVLLHQTVKKFSHCMECVFVTVFARALHSSLFWAKWTQFTHSTPYFCETYFSVTLIDVLVIVLLWCQDLYQWLTACPIWNQIELVAEFYVMNVQVCWDVGKTMLCILKDCNALIFRVWRCLKMSGTIKISILAPC